ncbi:MAG: glycosyltransferase family A protein [Phycisphaerales bacterium]
MTTPALRVSVCIPTHARADKLAVCLRGLAAQTVDPAAFEVLVGVDGHDDHAQEIAADAWISAGGRPDRLLVRQCQKRGPNAVRNALLDFASGDLLLFLNDDVRPDAGLIEAHLHAHDERAGAPALIVGAAPWVVHQPDRLFDRVVRETSMVFFYDRMSGEDPEHNWGFRHAWTLNLSAPADFVGACGGFPVVPSVYGYDDLAFAWTFCRAFDAPVLYRPEAIVHHDHRLEPGEYLERERQLGASAFRYAEAMPEFAAEVFRRDITRDDELDASRRMLSDVAAQIPTLERWFLALADRPASGHLPEVIAEAYERHLPLKRAMWRRGLLDAGASPRRAARRDTAA